MRSDVKVYRTLLGNYCAIVGRYEYQIGRDEDGYWNFSILGFRDGSYWKNTYDFGPPVEVDGAVVRELYEASRGERDSVFIGDSDYLEKIEEARI